MIKRFLKSSVIFFVILGVSFSNVPFYALSGLIDSYEKTSGIVDKIWLVQQNHDSDVVDKFISLRNISDKLKIHEAMAAAPTLMNSSATIGALTTASVTPVLPAHQIDDILLVSAWIRTTTGSLATPAGWTAINAGGTVRSTVSRYHWFWKRAVSASETNPVIAVTGGATADKYAKAHVIRGAINAGTPYEASAVTVGTVDPGVATGITTLTANALVVLVGGSEDNLASRIIVTATNPASLGTSSATSNRYNAVNTGADGASFIAAAERTTAGATGNVSFDFDGVPLGWGAYVLAFKPQPNTTTISDFVSAEPGNSTIAPNASGMVDSFGFATNAGTDTVTAATVGLAAGMGQYIQTVAITNDGDTVTYCSAAPSGDTASLSTCTVPVTTTNTQFKIKLTAKTHAVMPAPAGGSYAVTATVTGWTGTNATHAGTDSGSSTLTIDNASPNGATSVSGTAGNTANTINWTTSNSGDFDTTNGSVVLRWASGSAGAEVPAEGNSTYTAGNTITTATVACVISSAASAVQSKVDGTGGSAGCTTTALTNGQAYTYKAFQRDTNGNYDVGVLIGTFTPTAPATTLTISQTAGSKVATKNSGDVDQYAHDTACTGAGTCSAFTLASALGTANVTSIKITESGSVTANTELSDLNLYYDYDGNWADAGAETLFGTVANFAGDQTATVSGTLAITDGATAYIYARYDLANGANNPTGGATVNFQIAASTDVVSDATESGTGALVGTQTVRPNVTDVTDSALVDGGRNGETFTITGTGFGSSCASISVVVGGLTLTCNSAATTTISATIPSTQITTYGGASSMLVTVGGTVDDASQTYYVYPSVNLVSTPSVSNAARELENITLTNSTANASRFGATQGTVTFSGGFGSVGATVVTWGDTSIEVTVPDTIGDSTYLGDITVTRNADSKTDTAYGSNGFRVLPRITSNTPTSGIIADRIRIAGDHLCQGASCPISPNRSVANDNVKFGSTQALDGDFVNSGASPCNGNAQAWTDTEICVNVPAGTPFGSQPTIVRSNTYDSGTVAFTVNANTTTLATGSDPAVNTIAPGASATDVDLFTLQTNGGTESVTSVTVNLSTNSGIGLLAITDNANTVLGSTASPVTGSNVISVAGMSAGTGVTTFKVRVTPLSHAGMPAPAGASYAITAPVTAWAGPNTHAGSDTNTNALTIDNTSPAGTTGATPTAGDAQVQVSWTNPGDSDFQKVIIYCKTSSITETPTEGSDPSVDATACDATARVKYSGSVSPQTITGLSNGTLYYFRIYARDTNGNFTAIASTQQVSATPTLTQTLTVGTVGTQATNLNSGSTAQHIGGAGTAAFTLQVNTGSSNVTSVKVSETGTIAMADLANPKLYYENAVNAASCAYGGAESFVSGAAPVGETVTFTLPSVAVGLTANVTCLYFVSDVTSSAVGGQTIELQITNPSTDVAVSSGVNDDTVAKAIAGTTTIRPNVTDVTDSSLADGGRNGETFTITGAGFGSSCASISVVVGGLTLTCNSAATTTISATIPATQTTTFGGASSMLVTVGGTADDASQTYYVYPSVNLVSTPSVSNAAREGETITLTNSTANASRFGATEGTVTFSGGFGAVVAPAIDVTWGDTSITVIVPSAIGDTVYLGDITVTRNSDSKTDTAYGSNGFRVLPRITGLTSSPASVNDPIVVNGDHFCQSGTCPGLFSAANKVAFFSGVDATYWGAGGWTNTAIDTKVPAGATTGDVVVTSDTSYTSNGSTFTLADATPTNPANEKQARNSGITDLISAGGYASSTPVYFSLDTSSSVSGGTMYAQIELRPTTGVNSSFTSAIYCTANPYCFETSGGLSYTSGSITVTASTTSITDDVHHWQARVRYNKSGTDYYSGWVSYSDPAFRFDTINPVVTFTGADSCTTAVDNLGTNGARISWSFTPPSDVADGQVEYGTNSDLSGSTFSPIPPSAQSSNHAITLSNLNSNTTYYFKVRSRDTAGNLGTRPSVSPYCSFTTSSNLSPAKTTRVHIVGKTVSIDNGSPLTQTFTVFMPENATSTKSAFVEVMGVYTTTSGTPTIRVQVNGEAFKDYTLPPVSATSHFKILHQVSSVVVETANANTLYVTPGTNTTVYVNSADINVNYSYTP